MKNEIYLAAATGNIDDFLKEVPAEDLEAGAGRAVYSKNDILGLTSHDNNIIHVAAEHGHFEFIKRALECFEDNDATQLITAKNIDGDTPLHMAAKLQTSAVAKHLVEVARSSRPWEIQNKKRNSPLHVALMNGGKSIQVAAFLLEEGPEMASHINDRGEAPLHLAVHYDNQGAQISMKNMMNKLNGFGASLDYTESLFEEDSLKLIEELLKTSTGECCLKDKDGMTPLLRATLKSYVPAVEAIIKYCPESVEICDLKGKNILHHLKLSTFIEAFKILRKPGIPVLMDRQDEEGNTPVHIAIMNSDYNMVKAMIVCNANFAVENKKGISPATQLQKDSSSFLDKTDNIKKCNNIGDEVMPKTFFEAAYKGDWQNLRGILNEANSEEQYLSRLPDGTNILHVALLYTNDDYDRSPQQMQFIEEASYKFPILLCQTDFRGCTPLHYTMSGRPLHTMALSRLLVILSNLRDQGSCFLLPPWEAKDLNGDTPLHLAIKYGEDKSLKSLINLDRKLLRETNNSKETPLHYACRYEWSKIVSVLIPGDVLASSAVYSYDAEGFTPLLRAANCSNTSIVNTILRHYPDSIRQVDSLLGRNILHLMANLNPVSGTHKDLMKIPHMKILINQVDRQGNLPLHVALQHRRFGTAQLLIQLHFTPCEYLWLTAKNSDGKTFEAMLSTIQDVPREFEECLLTKLTDNPRVGLQLVGKSLYGVHYSNMKEFMGTLTVVAALLATITFTAAFTIPGGYDQNKGTPILAKKVAFQVFMFADVIGMCSSVMTLFCLIWFFTSSNIKNEGTKLGDLSMGLLQLSFYATLVAFMTGVYVTTSPQVHSLWLAIFTCIICSLVLLLTKKYLIMNYLVHVFYCLDAIPKGVIKFLITCIKTVVSCCLKSNSQANDL